MKTDSLILLLARGAGPAQRAASARRIAPAALAGLLVSTGLALALLGPVPGAMFATAVPWIKLAYGTSLALAAAWLTARLSRPIARLRPPRRAVAAVVAAMALVGLAAHVGTPAGERVAALLGHSWSTCPASVLLLSLPALAAALWAVRGLAPTRPRAAGGAAGLLAGSVGAMGYSLSCPEASAAFVAVWYTLGIALTGLLGAALGPRMLRW
jgi:hypothetical protein